MFKFLAAKVAGFAATKFGPWLVLGAVLAVAGVFAAGYGYGYGKGRGTAAEDYFTRLGKLQEQHQQERDAAQRALEQANQQNRQQELEHEQRVTTLVAEYERREGEARAQDAAVIAGLRSGTDRLRFQVSSCRSASSGPIDPASNGVDESGSAELAPETSAALWAIAADGDRAIRKLTGLQTWAKSALTLCNPPPEEE